MKNIRAGICRQILSMLVLVGGFAPAMALAQDGASRHQPAAGWDVASKIVVQTTVTRRGTMGETRRSSTTEVFHTDGRGRTRLDRGPWVVLWTATEPRPRIFDRRTGAPVPLLPLQTATPPGGAGRAAPLGRILKEEDLGERRITGVAARGVRVRYEMPNTQRADGPPFELWTETWKSADGRVLEKKVWDRSLDQTELMQYGYEPIASVPEELFEFDARAQ
jgi:hypothetical protein